MKEILDLLKKYTYSERTIFVYKKNQITPTNKRKYLYNDWIQDDNPNEIINMTKKITFKDILYSNDTKINLYSSKNQNTYKNIENICNYLNNKSYNENFINNNQINKLQELEIRVEKLGLKHANIGIENNNIFGQISITSGKIMPIISLENTNKEIKFKSQYISSELYKNNEDKLSIIKAITNKEKNLSYALLESNLYNKTEINELLNINNINNLLIKKICEDLMKTYGINDSKELNKVIRNLLLQHKIILFNGEFIESNKIIYNNNDFNNVINKNNYNITEIHEIVNNLLN